MAYGLPPCDAITLAMSMMVRVPLASRTMRLKLSATGGSGSVAGAAAGVAAGVVAERAAVASAAAQAAPASKVASFIEISPVFPTSLGRGTARRDQHFRQQTKNPVNRAVHGGLGIRGRGASS